jgi:hypothetical protein
MRFWMLAGVIACHGKDDGSGATLASDPGVPLSTTAGAFEVAGDVQSDDCNDDEVDQALGDVELKFDQVATGLSVFVDPDMGWIPCDGSIRSFSCEWGNAPSSTPAGSWIWTLVGTSDGSTVEATLTLTVTCSGTGDCRECSAVEEISGSLL